MCLSRSDSEQQLLAKRRGPKGLEPTEVQVTPLQEGMCGKAAGSAAGEQVPLGDPVIDTSDDGQLDEVQHNRVRMREFALIYAAYMGFLLVRKNYGFWLPSVLSEMGKGKGEAGLLGSTFEVAYGAASLLNGVLIDMASPKYLLVGGLALSGLVSACIGGTAQLPMMVALWGCNGVIQSVGWPSITNIFLAWFPDPAARGAWYSLLSTCQNVGAALVPLLVSSSISRWGWKAALYAPAAASVIIAAALGMTLHGSPEAVQNASNRGPTAPSPTSRAPWANLRRMLSEQVVLNPALWLMAVNYFGVSMVRTCLSDWSNVFLGEAKGLPLAMAARCLFLMEIGGFAGSLTAGAMSDMLFAGRRGPIVCICSLLLSPVLFALVSLESPLLVQACYLLLGFFAFPVHVLLGLFSREVVPAGVSTSAGGFVKCIAQIGGAFAGYPLGALQQRAGWGGVLSVLAVVALLSALAALPLWSTTAQHRIRARNGTVQDFSKVGKTS